VYACRALLRTSENSFDGGIEKNRRYNSDVEFFEKVNETTSSKNSHVSVERLYHSTRATGEELLPRTALSNALSRVGVLASFTSL
jgi:hypothetical protein